MPASRLLTGVSSDFAVISERTGDIGTVLIVWMFFEGVYIIEAPEIGFEGKFCGTDDGTTACGTGFMLTFVKLWVIPPEDLVNTIVVLSVSSLKVI
jgi:hypothetical protein